MIKVNELRTGNIIDTFLGWCIVDEIFHDIVTVEIIADKDKYLQLINEEIDYIPLTPEILESCGFKKTDSGFEKPKCDFYLDKDLFAVFGMDGEERPYKTVKVKYLHQLQNLYFALIGEELTVNMHHENTIKI